MKYKCTHITKNGLNDYILRIEESTSFLDRFLFSKNPIVHILYGGNRFWEYSVCGIRVPQELKDFANEIVGDNG
jgi:hypothetical protein